MNISYYIQFNNKNFHISYISYRINNLLNKIMFLKIIYRKTTMLFLNTYFKAYISIQLL